jgi:hypothetical protein
MQSIAPCSKRLILHVGPHKTGSTYLQHRLLKSRNSLREYLWEYPDFGIQQFAHHKIYSWLANNSADVDGVNDTSIAALVEKFPQLILSSEDFVYLSKNRLQHLKSLMPGTDIQVIYFLRSPIDTWPSHWQELVRHGKDMTFLEYLCAFIGWTAPFEVSIMNPITQMAKFVEVFGRHAVRIVCYDNLIYDKIDIFDYFCSNILQVDAPIYGSEARIIHASQPDHMIEMIRTLNETYRERTGRSPNDKILAAYQKKRNAFEASPNYDSFRETFVMRAAQVQLSSGHELMRHRELMLLHRFGANIENKMADNRLFCKDIFERVVPYAQRYWIDKFGLRDYVNEILHDLEVI